MGSVKEANAVRPVSKSGFAVAELAGTKENVWSDMSKNLTKTVGFDEFVLSVNKCRFFYKTEPVVSTVVNKLVEIGINDITFSKNGLSDNEFRVFTALKPRLLKFAEKMAQEYLLSGLVVPEVGYNKVDKDFIFSLGVKKISSLVLPDSMWVRDPKSIKIYTSLLSDKPSYYVIVPQEIITFIKNKGRYPDGKEDKELYELLMKYYPDFVKEILKGAKEIQLINKLVIRRKYLADNPYPIPYIQSALEALQHKRKLRRMDYSIIDKVLSAILHIKVGSDEFPVTEEDDPLVEDIRTQLKMRQNTDQNLERIFQLLTNHTVQIDWIFPDTSPLLDKDKYSDINEEILYALGFPRVLIAGESLRSSASDFEIAMHSPVKTMESFRRDILSVIQDIVREVCELNKFKSVPTVTFKAINLYNFKDFVLGLTKLYDISALSRSSIDEAYGYDFYEEIDKLAEEQKAIVKRGLPEFGLTPNSRPPQNQQPNQDGNNTDNNTDDNNNKTKTEKPPAPKPGE